MIRKLLSLFRKPASVPYEVRWRAAVGSGPRLT